MQAAENEQFDSGTVFELEHQTMNTSEESDSPRSTVVIPRVDVSNVAVAEVAKRGAERMWLQHREGFRNTVEPEKAERYREEITVGTRTVTYSNEEREALVVELHWNHEGNYESQADRLESGASTIAEIMNMVDSYEEALEIATPKAEQLFRQNEETFRALFG